MSMSDTVRCGSWWCDLQSPGRPRSPPYRHGASSDWSTSAWMETPMGGSQARRMSDGNVSRGGSVLPVT
eukprot:1182122-Rhodomonas_salina.4